MKWMVTLSSTLALASALALVPQESVADVPPPGTHPQTIWSDGTQRNYLLHVPAGYDGHKPLPLVFVLHGFGGNAQGMEASTGMSLKADTEGFFVAYLNGTPCVPGDPPDHDPACTGQLAWNSGLTPRLGITVDDVRFVREVLRRLQDELRVDVRRVYAAGLSNGAFMCHRLGADLPDLLAGVAIVEGTIGIRDLDGDFRTIPAPVGSIPVAIIHGIEDPSVLYYGGPGGPQGFLDVKPVADAVDFWTAANRCNGGPDTQASGEVVTTTYSGCFANSDVVLFTLTDGKHKWPTIEDPGVVGSDLIWEFFSRHPRT
jgi:polyhydroxybutyrate depolymerase